MSEHQHFIVHKPYGYLTQFVYNEKKRRNRKLLGELGNFPEGIMAIGRLDKNTEGLLLLTTDGKVSQQVRSKRIEKEYYVQVEGLISKEAIQSLKEGVLIKIRKETYNTLPCKVRLLNPAPVFDPAGTRVRHEGHGPTSWISITIREGKFRQVRKMASVVGFAAIRLIRVRIGDIRLGDLKSSEVIEVNGFSMLDEDQE